MPTADILIIEDDAKIARLIELELKCEGYHTRVISDGMAVKVKAALHAAETLGKPCDEKLVSPAKRDDEHCRQRKKK